jgi:peptidoglycan hydrolase FlgJ
MMKTSLDILPVLKLHAPKLPSGESPEQIKEASIGFEAILLKQMIHSMRSTVTEGGLFPKSAGHDIIDDLMDEQLAQHLAESGTLGLADMIAQHVTNTSVSAKKAPDLQEEVSTIYKKN